MFFQLDLLKPGGKFHICWLAGSWPERFSAITQRQLGAVDITKLCEELLEIIQRESRSPYNRFSLRLSCQLVRGITFVYRRKANACLSDICVLNAKILRQKRLKDTPKEPQSRDVGTRSDAESRLPHPNTEEQVAELIQHSENVVASIEEITLREEALPPAPVIYDGFGEEDEQALNSLLQLSELMVGRSEHSLLGQVSGADLTVLQDSRDIRGERDITGTRARMEGIVEDSFLLLNVADAELDQQMPDYSLKDIPEIPEIQDTYPDISKIQEAVQEIPTVIVTEMPTFISDTKVASPAHSTPAPPPSNIRSKVTKQKEDIQLESLEARTPTSRPKKLKVDKRIIIDSNIMRARIADVQIESRCENIEQNRADVNLPTESFFKRPSCAGIKNRVCINQQFMANFQKCCMAGPMKPREEREKEVARKALEVSAMNITTEPANINFKTPSPRPPPANIMMTIEDQELPIIVEEKENENSAEKENRRSQLDLADLPTILGDVNNSRVDISDLPTQIITEGRQQSLRKRTSDLTPDNEISTKVRHVSRTSMQARMSCEQPGMLVQINPEVISTTNVMSQGEPQHIIPIEKKYLEKPREEISHQSEQTKTPLKSKSKSPPQEATVKELLLSAGLADKLTNAEQSISVQNTRRSRDSETPLGSLDRTAVSLGDSTQSTSSKNYIKEAWGTEATMCRIVVALRRGMRPLTVKNLLDMEPLDPAQPPRSRIAASCFYSILKLKQSGFLRVTKDNVTLEIMDMDLGPKITNIQ